MWVTSLILGWEDPLEEEMVVFLLGKISWTEKPGSYRIIQAFKIFSSIWMSYIFLGICVFVDFKCPDIKSYTVFPYFLTSTTSVIIILFSFLTSVIQIFLLFKNIILTKVYLALSYNQHFSLFIFYLYFLFYCSLLSLLNFSRFQLLLFFINS